MTLLNGKNGLSKKRERTASKIIEALSATNGLLTMAAHRAGVSYTTIVRYAKDLPSVRQAVDDAKESMTDYTEGKLFTQIKDGNITAIIFYLKTKGKDRGYVERHEWSGKDGGPVKVEHDAKGKLISLLDSIATKAAAREGDQQS